jgi:hypothetical protein
MLRLSFGADQLMCDARGPRSPVAQRPRFSGRRSSSTRAPRVAACVRCRSSSSGQSASTAWLLWRPSSSTVDDPPDTRDEISSPRAATAPSARTGRGGRIRSPVRSSPSSSRQRRDQPREPLLLLQRKEAPRRPLTKQGRQEDRPGARFPPMSTQNDDRSCRAWRSTSASWLSGQPHDGNLTIGLLLVFAVARSDHRDPRE